jgi:hypothetical protein
MVPEGPPGRFGALVSSSLALVDRLVYARTMVAGERVLDIGGRKMPNCSIDSPFSLEYNRIQREAAEYRIVDYQDVPGVDYVLDLNHPANITKLIEIIEEYKPSVILCMEVLEHINCHFEVMNAMAGAIAEYGTRVFITIPNNGNWVFNILGWNEDHSIAFFRDIAWRFITRSELGKYQVTMLACMQKYLWYWWIVYLISFRQPLSWGFLVSAERGRL